MLLDGFVAIVTGGARGIGRVLCEELAADGCIVGCLDINLEQAKQVVEAIRGVGGTAIALQADVTNQQDVDTAVEKMIEEFGEVNLLVNGARLDPFIRGLTESEYWRRTLDVSVRGAWNCSRSVIPHMRRHKFGRIIMLSSLQAELGSRLDQIPYGIAKAGMANLMMSLARELVEDGITVNAIAPGTIKTEMLTKRLDRHQREALLGAIPAKRWGSGREIYEAVRFLARAGFVTGSTIPINGGVLLGKGVI